LGAYIDLGRQEPENKRRLGVNGDNIKMNLKDIGCEGVDWIHLAQYRVQWRGVVDTVVNLRVP